jgi:hypothetical protein
MRVIRRMTESVNPAVRVERACMGNASLGEFYGYGTATISYGQSVETAGSIMRQPRWKINPTAGKSVKKVRPPHLGGGLKGGEKGSS